MKIQCALSQSQVEKLYSNVYGHMVKQGNEFNPEQYMKDLFNKIAKNSDVDTATKFLQQVPSMIRVAAARPNMEEFEIKTDSLIKLIRSFKKNENGFDNVYNYFRPQLDPDVEKELIEKKALKAFHITEKTNDTIPVDPFEYQTSVIISTTFQEFISKNPNEATSTETFDLGRKTIYRALNQIKTQSDSTAELGSLVYQDKVLYLKPVRLSDINKSNLDKTTQRLVTKAQVLKSKGLEQSNVTTLDNIFIMLITDEDGKEILFNEEGDIVETNGQIVYQFLREVRKEGDKFKLTDIYGKSDKAIDPEIIAKKFGISIEEAEKKQQEDLKSLYDFREKLINGKQPLVSITGISEGISEVRPDSLNLSNITSILEDNNNAIETLSVVKSDRSGFEKGEAVINIKGNEYKVDRPNLTDDLINQIAEVLTNPKISNKVKYNFVSQFLADKADFKTRKHNLEYLEKTKELIFSYSPTTYEEGYTEFIKVDLNSPGAKDVIYDALKFASGTEKQYFSAKMTYSDEALQKGYQDYDIATGKISFDYKDYISFLKTLPNTKIFADITVDSRSFNSYIKFSLPNEFTEELSKVEQEESPIVTDDQFELSIEDQDKTYPLSVTEKRENLISLLQKGEDITGTISKPFGSMTRWEMITSEGDIIEFYNKENNITENDLNAVVSLNLVPKAIFNNKEFTNVIEVKNGDKLLGYVRESENFENKPVVQRSIEEIEKEINNTLDPEYVSTPEDDGSGDIFFLRKSDLPSDVTPEQIENALNWWNSDSNILNKYIGLKQVANIVNSNAYARFIAYGATLNGNMGMIEIADSGNMVDVYHEAWHAFSQLFLTKAEKTALYNEVIKKTGKNLSFFEIEELLAEDYREYAKNPKTAKGSPKRNTIFRKIFNFLKALFGKGSVVNLSDISTVNELFENLYLGKNLNNYTPLIDNVMFDILHRNSGIVKPGTETEQVLNRQDSNLLSDSMDSIISEIIDNLIKTKNNKGASLSILLDKRNREPLYTLIKNKLDSKLKNYQNQLEATPKDAENEYKISVLENRIRIIQAGIDNYGDSKTGLVKYHIENSSYDLMRQKYIALELDEEGQLIEPDNVENTERYGDQKQNDKSLVELAGKETLYILKSLHQATIDKKTGNIEYQYNELGFKKLTDFRAIWNNTVRTISGIQDPQKMYDALSKEAAIVPEFKQLVEFKLANPEVPSDNAFEFQATTSIWQDFSKTRVPYIQLTLFKTDDGYTAEVTEASNELSNVIKNFIDKFKGDVNNAYVERVGKNNTPMLNLQKVVDTFSVNGKFDVSQSFNFARAIGLNLSDLSIIKNTLKKDTRTIEEFGLPYIFDIIKKLNDKEKLPNLNSTTRSAITKFKENPIQILYKGLPANIIGATEINQKNKLLAIAGLESRYGTTGSAGMVLNAERNLVSEFIDNHTISKQIFALNNAKKLSDLWTTDEFQYMSYMNPEINPYTMRSGVIRSLYNLQSAEQTRRANKSLLLFADSGTQEENAEGTNTTSLDVNSKMIQEMHTMLKDGVQEFMRHASKSSSFGARIEGGIMGLPGKDGSDNNLWIDLDMFGNNTAFVYALKAHIIPYMEAEAERIYRFKLNKSEFEKYAGYNRQLANGKMAGEEFTAFDDILSDTVKQAIYKEIDNAIANNILFNLSNFLRSNPNNILQKVSNDVKKYFNKQTTANKKILNESKYISSDLKDRMKVFNLKDNVIEDKLVEAYTYNAWIHNFEMGILFYGDFAQYNHYKEEMHKRNTGSTSGGRGFRTDIAARNFVKGYLANTSYSKKQGLKTIAYNGTYNTAILQDVKRNSVYLKQIEKGLRKDYELRYKKAGIPNAEQIINERLAIELSKYKKMEEGDGQGFITFDAYRTLRYLENAWSNEQEILFQKIVRGEEINAHDIHELFPVYKVQHFGNLANTELPVNAMHKFALAPLIPSVIAGSDLDSLHRQMINKNIQYVTFQTGSKVGSVTSEVNDKGEAVADKIYNDSEKKSLIQDIQFTPNTIYLENLKNVTNVPNKYKNKTVFSTQLRKLILNGMYKRGNIVNSKNNADAIKTYENTVDDYSNILKLELLNEIGYEYKNGKYIGNLDDFLNIVQRELERRDMPEHLIHMVGLNRDKSLKTDLSLHLKADDIEKILVALVEKRLIKQKVKGEALVQVASSMSNGIWDAGLKKGTESDIEKYMGTNNLPFYYANPNGITSAMKVAIALQGDFANLLKVKHLDGKPIATKERLNEMIKNDEWLNIGNNRKSVTLAAVRIPVQGLNSMEFMEVYEFLDPAAGNIIIPPTEIVAKSGADFDVDKLTTFMPTINGKGQYVSTNLTNKDIQDKVNEAGDDVTKKNAATNLIKQQKAALENKLIESIKGILELEDNYASLVRPNDTYLLKDEIADKYQDDVIEYDRFKNVHTKGYKLNKKGDKVISPTRILEVGYNLHKHDVNMIGKKVLGMIAVENSLHPVFNSIGMSLPATYKNPVYDDALQKFVNGSIDYQTRLLLPHNKTDDGRISLSDIDTVDGIDNIADLFSQMMNGAVDVEKDAWIFFIQGNYEITPMITFLFKAGVPKEQAILFVSNPIVREYAKQQRSIKSAYAKLTGTIPEDFINSMGKYKAAINALNKFGIRDGNKKVSSKKYYNAAIQSTSKSGILNSKGEFDMEMMKNVVKNPNDPALKDYMEAMFLHFLELEKSTRGFTTLKFLSNPDTKTSKTLQEVIRRNMDLEDIKALSTLEEGTVDKLYKSVLGTFFDNKLINDIIVPLFELRNNDTVTNYILNTLSTEKASIVRKFGRGQDGIRSFITEFKNSIPNYIFQNYMSNFIDENGELTSMPKIYKKLEIVKKVGVLNGAQIIDNKLYVDENQLRKEYKEGLYLRSNTEPGNYNEQGLRGFRYNLFESESEYFKYTFERANQKRLNPIQGLSKDKTFTNLVSKLNDEKAAYEAYINQRALIYAFNRQAVMELEGQSYTDMVLDLIEEFSHLKGRYPILGQLTKPNIKGNEIVLTLNDKAMLKDPQLAEIYYQNILDLANKEVAKVSDIADNKRISELFSLLPLMSVYQHGTGYSKYGFNEALPYDDFLRVMLSASKIFIKKQLNDKTLNGIFEKLIDSPTRNFINFVRDPETYVNPKTVEPLTQKNILDAKSQTIQDMLARAEMLSDEEAIDNNETPTQQSTQPAEVKEGVQELFESNPELANIGTPEQYSQYLDAIFPDSKVKDIVYHGTGEGNKIETLNDRTYFSNLLEASRYAAWDLKNREQYAFEQGVLDNLNVSLQIIPAIINLQNPKYLQNQPYAETEKNYNGYDGIYSKDTIDPLGGQELQIVVNKSDQIHILGSQQDIEGFKNFVLGATDNNTNAPEGLPGIDRTSTDCQ